MYLTWIGFLCEYGIKFPFCCFWKCFHLEPPSSLSIWVLVSSLPFLIYFSFPLHLKLIIRLLLCHSSVPSHLLPASIEKTPWCFVRKTLKTWRRGASTQKHLWWKKAGEMAKYSFDSSLHLACIDHFLKTRLKLGKSEDDLAHDEKKFWKNFLFF